MTLEKLSEEFLPAIEAELQRCVAHSDGSGLAGLKEILAYHLGWEGEGAGSEARGKRIRPLLVLLCATAAGGDWQTALPAAAAVELVHNFSLIHDDIEDNSPLRRGRHTIWKKWGIPQAINAGDAMFTLAHLEILELENVISHTSVLQAARLLQQTCLHLTQGQYLDLFYENTSDLTIDDYWPMINGKTAALLATCTKLGALVAGVEASRQRSFHEFGRLLGLAFQAQDDLLGIWGDAELTGKSAESDLVTGKKTLPVLYGLSQRGRFYQRWRMGMILPDEVMDVAGILEQEGGRSFTQQTANQLTSQALQSLDQARPFGEAGEGLRELAHKLLQRHG